MGEIPEGDQIDWDGAVDAAGDLNNAQETFKCREDDILDFVNILTIPSYSVILPEHAVEAGKGLINQYGTFREFVDVVRKILKKAQIKLTELSKWSLACGISHDEYKRRNKIYKGVYYRTLVLIYAYEANTGKTWPWSSGTMGGEILAWLDAQEMTFKEDYDDLLERE